MLKHQPSEGLKISTNDVQQYLALQDIARALKHHDIVEYWKSAPYLLNFMENYQLKKKLNDALTDKKQYPELQKALRHGKATFLNVKEIRNYDRIDPGNARLAGLLQDTVERGAWQMLWIPPTWSYYEGDGPFADQNYLALLSVLSFLAGVLRLKQSHLSLVTKLSDRCTRSFGIAQRTQLLRVKNVVLYCALLRPRDV